MNRRQWLALLIGLVLIVGVGLVAAPGEGKRFLLVTSTESDAINAIHDVLHGTLTNTQKLSQIDAVYHDYTGPPSATLNEIHTIRHNQQSSAGKVAAIHDIVHEYLAGSTTTTAPPPGCTGVQVAAGSNLVTVANAHPAGTTFCLAAGTYITGTIPAQTADKWVGTLGTGNARLSIISGNDSTRFLLNGTATDVVFRDLIIEKFKGQVVDNTNTQDGIFAGSWIRMLVDNVESRNNWGAGMVIFDGSIIRNSYLHHNRWLGITSHQADNVLIEGNDISFNNYLGEHSWLWAAGGVKVVVDGSNVTYRTNHVYNNCGPGLWSDNVGAGFIYEGNDIHDNFAPGIMHEISKQAIIRNNLVQRNAWAVLSLCNGSQTGGGERGGILISNSENVEIHSNTLVDNEDGIRLRDYDRGASQEHTVGIYVHDNESTYINGGITGCDNNGPTAQCHLASANNRWVNNKYHVGTDPTPFLWAGAERTWAQWQAYGFDLTGTID